MQESSVSVLVIESQTGSPVHLAWVELLANFFVEIAQYGFLKAKDTLLDLFDLMLYIPVNSYGQVFCGTFKP